MNPLNITITNPVPSRDIEASIAADMANELKIDPRYVEVGIGTPPPGYGQGVRQIAARVHVVVGSVCLASEELLRPSAVSAVGAEQARNVKRALGEMWGLRPEPGGVAAEVIRRLQADLDRERSRAESAIKQARKEHGKLDAIRDALDIRKPRG